MSNLKVKSQVKVQVNYKAVISKAAIRQSLAIRCTIKVGHNKYNHLWGMVGLMILIHRHFQIQVDSLDTKPMVLLIPRPDEVLIKVGEKQYLKAMTKKQMLWMAFRFLSAALEMK